MVWEHGFYLVDKKIQPHQAHLVVAGTWSVEDGECGTGFICPGFTTLKLSEG